MSGREPRHDAIVVGAGIAGLVTALRCRELGLTVLVIEQDGREASSSAMSSGNLHLTHRSVHRSPEELDARVHAILGPDVDERLSSTLANEAGRSIDWLAARGVEVKQRGQGEWQSAVITAPPPFTSTPLLPVLERFRGELQALGAMATGCVVESAARDGEEWLVAGTRADGRHTWRSRCVVLADGGFLGDDTLVRKHLGIDPDDVIFRGGRAGNGLAIRVARAAGGRLSRLDTFFGCLLSADARERDALRLFPSLDQLAIASIVVGRDGRRIADEGRGASFLANALARTEDGLGWIILDARTWQERGTIGNAPPNPLLVERGGTVVSGDTIEILADRAGLAARQLADTVRDYSQAVRTGQLATLPIPRTTPPDLLRDARFYSEPLAIEAPPFYAIPTRVGITNTSGGPLVDEHGRVRAAVGTIEGLYAAGVSAAGLETARPGGYVSGLIRSIVGGLAVAEDIARRSSD